MSAFDTGSGREPDKAIVTEPSGTALASSQTEGKPTPASAPTVAPRNLEMDKAELGRTAPEFALNDVNGKVYKLSQFKGRVIVLEWFNPRCTYCLDIYKNGGVLREMPERWTSEGVVWLSINSQGPEEAGSGIEENKKFARDHGMRTTLLMDTTGAVGRAYGAKSTPHVFVISEKGLLVYRGALDNAPFGVVPAQDVKTNYVDCGLKELRSGHAVTVSETKPYGCPVNFAKP